jgi:hypothetical protein
MSTIGLLSCPSRSPRLDAIPSRRGGVSVAHDDGTPAAGPPLTSVQMLSWCAPIGPLTAVRRDARRVERYQHLHKTARARLAEIRSKLADGAEVGAWFGRESGL